MKQHTVAIPPFGQTTRSEIWEPQPLESRRRAAFVPAGRTLHLIDVENLMGGPLTGSVALESALAGFRRLAPVHRLDHAVIGTNPALAVAISCVWPSARLVVRGGPDGADRALLAVVNDVAWIASRYDRVVVGSGDGIFSVAVADLRTAGIAVDVVTRPASLSMPLAALASSVTFIPAGRESLA